MPVCESEEPRTVCSAEIFVSTVCSKVRWKNKNGADMLSLYNDLFFWLLL